MPKIRELVMIGCENKELKVTVFEVNNRQLIVIRDIQTGNLTAIWNDKP